MKADLELVEALAFSASRENIAITRARIEELVEKGALASMPSDGALLILVEAGLALVQSKHAVIEGGYLKLTRAGDQWVKNRRAWRAARKKEKAS